MDDPKWGVVDDAQAAGDAVDAGFPLLPADEGVLVPLFPDSEAALWAREAVHDRSSLAMCAVYDILLVGIGPLARDDALEGVAEWGWLEGHR